MAEFLNQYGIYLGVAVALLVVIVGIIIVVRVIERNNRISREAQAERESQRKREEARNREQEGFNAINQRRSVDEDVVARNRHIDGAATFAGISLDDDK